MWRTIQVPTVLIDISNYFKFKFKKITVRDAVGVTAHLAITYEIKNRL